MKKEDRFTISLMIGALILALGCGGELKTGTRKQPDNKPAADGTCPAERSLCGTGAYAFCRDLQNDPEHCGTCDRVCSPGIACQAGVCQQTLCTGATVPFSNPTTPSASGTGAGAAFGAVVLADVNGDGTLDLVEYQQRFSGMFRVSLGQPGGGFATPEAYPSTNVLKISAADVNADGIDDLLVVSSPTPWIPPSHVEVWLGHPDGHLTKANPTNVSATTNTIMAVDMAVVDISGDGWPDLVIPADIGSGRIRVFVSDSTGALHLSNTYDTGSQFISIHIRDWDGDGSPDLVVQTTKNYSLQILYNRGDGTFDPPVDCAVSVSLAIDIVVEDFNRDGRMDLAMPTESGTRVGVALGLGECSFEPFSFYDVPGDKLEVLRAADMNGDGQLDLITIGKVGPLIDSPQDHLLTVLLGKPDGTFEPPGTSMSLGSLGSSDITDLAVGEVTGDQRPDIVLSLFDGQVTTWKNSCP